MTANDAPPTRSGPGQGPSLLIRALPVPAEDVTPRWERVLPAWILSGAAHVILFVLFLLVRFNDSTSWFSDDWITEPFTFETEEDRAKNLTNTDLGSDPNLDVNFAVNNLGEASIAGFGVMADNDVAALAAPDGPHTLVAPRGFDVRRSELPDEGPPIGIPPNHVCNMPPRNPFEGRRDPMTRQKLLQANGGNARSEQAVALGLQWLAGHQAADGHWSFHDFAAHGKCNCQGGGAHNDVAATALALLPFLGSGETPRGNAQSTRYAKVVERGLKWLIAQQAADGRFGDGYAHAIASIALCEALGMTNDPWLKGPAQRAIGCCVQWQAPGGGFRYMPKQEGDLSVSGWHIQALKSGQMCGLHIPNATFAGVQGFLDKVGTPDGSGYGYTSAQPTQRMTSVGLLCRTYLGWGPRHPGLQGGVDMLRRVPPSPAVKDVYYYYYATQVLHRLNGDAWEEWNPKMRELLVGAQEMGPELERRHVRGSWSPDGDAFGKDLGRLGVTALSLLTLEVYYRHLPLYQRHLAAVKPEAVR
jgi:hypothetical protein